MSISVPTKVSVKGSDGRLRHFLVSSASPLDLNVSKTEKQTSEGTKQLIFASQIASTEEKSVKNRKRSKVANTSKSAKLAKPKRLLETTTVAKPKPKSQELDWKGDIDQSPVESLVKRYAACPDLKQLLTDPEFKFTNQHVLELYKCCTVARAYRKSSKKSADLVPRPSECSTLVRRLLKGRRIACPSTYTALNARLERLRKDRDNIQHFHKENQGLKTAFYATAFEPCASDFNVTFYYKWKNRLKQQTVEKVESKSTNRRFSRKRPIKIVDQSQPSTSQEDSGGTVDRSDVNKLQKMFPLCKDIEKLCQDPKFVFTNAHVIDMYRSIPDSEKSAKSHFFLSVVRRFLKDRGFAYNSLRIGQIRRMMRSGEYRTSNASFLNDPFCESILPPRSFSSHRRGLVKEMDLVAQSDLGVWLRKHDGGLLFARTTAAPRMEENNSKLSDAFAQALQPTLRAMQKDRKSGVLINRLSAARHRSFELALELQDANIQVNATQRKQPRSNVYRVRAEKQLFQRQLKNLRRKYENNAGTLSRMMQKTSETRSEIKKQKAKINSLKKERAKISLETENIKMMQEETEQELSHPIELMEPGPRAKKYSTKFVSTLNHLAKLGIPTKQLAPTIDYVCDQLTGRRLACIPHDHSIQRLLPRQPTVKRLVIDKHQQLLLQREDADVLYEIVEVDDGEEDYYVDVDSIPQQAEQYPYVHNMKGYGSSAFIGQASRDLS